MEVMTALGAETRLDKAKAGNQPGSVKRLWLDMARETPSVPDQEPTGSGPDVLRSSLRGPEERLRSRRAPVRARALKMPVPDSSSEPAMRRAVPERVTSVSDVLPCKAASDC